MYWPNGLYTLTVSFEGVEINTFQSANPGAGIANGTQITSAWLNDVNQELINIVIAGGLTPAPNTPTQVLAALENIFATKAQADPPALQISTATTLTTANLGGVVEMIGSTAFTTTLPTPVGNSGTIMFFNNSIVAQTVQTPAGTIYGPASSTTSTVIPAGQIIEITSDSNNWFTEGTPQSGAAAGGNNNSGTGTTLSTSVTFTPPRTCKILVSANCGGGTGVTGIGVAVSGCSLVSQTSNWVSGGSGQNIGVYTGVFTAFAGATVTLTASMSTPSSGSNNIGITYLVVPAT